MFASYIALLLVYAEDITKIENITYYKYMREKKHVLAHYNGTKPLFSGDFSLYMRSISL